MELNFLMRRNHLIERNFPHIWPTSVKQTTNKQTNQQKNEKLIGFINETVHFLFKSH